MMKKLILIFLLTACTATSLPASESTSTPVPAFSPTVIPSATPEIPSPTIALTAEATPTAELTTERVSPIDGMPQAYIPAGTFRMGGMDVRRAPNELPEHDVTLDAFWMDRLEVTNAMFMLCVKAGACDPP